MHTDYQNQISKLFFKMERYMQSNDIERADIMFPRGVLRTADYFREELCFIDNPTFQSNLAYHLMLSDLYRWLLNRFDIKLTAKEMIIKEGICLFGNICGSICQYYGKRILNSKDDVGLKTSLSLLIDNKIIDQDLKKKIRYLWGQRNKEHISSLKIVEFKKYDLDKYNNAVDTWIELKEALKKAKKEDKL